MTKIIPNENSWIGFLPDRASGPVLAAPSAGSGGTLAAGTYRYVVSAVLPSGAETAASNEQTVVVGAAGTVTNNWSAVPNAVSYKVYRSPSAGASQSENTYFTVAAPTTTHTDNGSAGTAGTPKFGTSGLASAAAPSLASELANAVDLTAFCVSITAQTTGNTVPTPSLATKFETTIQGTYAASFTADFYRDDTTDTAWLTLPRNTKGTFIISRFGGKSAVKQGYVAVGDTVEVWPIIVVARSASNMTSNTAQMFTMTASVPTPPTENAVVAA